tara:strand:- start:56 stop:430 length:375 start_codon:yes stop_codon:yes gene_type:complete
VLLPDAVRARHRLQVHLRVPVRVEEDDRVGALQVEAEAAGARGEHEYEVGRVGRVELRQQVAAVVTLGVAIEPQVAVPHHLAVLLEQVHELHHLREDEHPVPQRLELGQDAVEQLELARRAPDV